MGSMSSPNKIVNSLRFEVLPKKPISNCSFAISNGTIVIRGARGTLYTNCSLARKVHYGKGIWSFSYDITECLDQLGILSSADRVQIDEFHARCEKTNAAKDLLRAIAISRNPTNKIPGIRHLINATTEKKAWDLLDWHDQDRMVKCGYQPRGLASPMKPKPKLSDTALGAQPKLSDL